MENKKIITILQSSFIYVFIFLVVGGLGSWLIFKKVKSDEAGLEVAKNNYNETLKQLESFDKVKKDFDESVGLRDQISNMVVRPEGTLGLIEELEGAASSSGITLSTSISDNPVSRKNPKIGQSKNSNTNADQEIWLELNAEGKYSNILQFIKYLENAKRLIAISTISIEQSEKLAPEEVLNSAEGTLGNLKAKILVSNVF